MPLSRRIFAALAAPFRTEKGVAWPVIAAFVFINGLVLLNAILHDPKIGYDASAHLKYATHLATTGQLPAAKDTSEFFSPPLPYVPLALLWASMDASGRDADASAFKIAQLIQVGYSLVLTFFVLKLCRLVRRGPFVATVALLLLATIPAYIRTFAMIRGEPLLATLGVVGTYLALRTFAVKRPALGSGAAVGLILGLAVLSRQWAFFLLPPLGLVGIWRLIVDRPARGATIRAGLVTLATFAVVGMPFYLHLHREYGTIRAFNRAPESDEANAAQPERIDFGTMLGRLATRPIRDALIHHPAAIFYADVWGDYWQYYLVYARESYGKNKTRYAKPVDVERAARRANVVSNYDSIPAYLGRACVAGAVPSALCLGGVIAGLVGLRQLRKKDDSLTATSAIASAALALCVVSTLIGYGWFVASYPSDEGDTIKASYPLQLYAPLAILGAALLADLGRRWPRAGVVLVALLIIVALHNLPACVTRYW